MSKFNELLQMLQGRMLMLCLNDTDYDYVYTLMMEAKAEVHQLWSDWDDLANPEYVDFGAN